VNSTTLVKANEALFPKRGGWLLVKFAVFHVVKGIHLFAALAYVEKLLAKNLDEGATHTQHFGMDFGIGVKKAF
jgi:hypothetical protein